MRAKISRESLDALGRTMKTVSVVIALYVQPYLTALVVMITIGMKLFGVIEWSWIWVIFGPGLFLGVPLLLLALVLWLCGRFILLRMIQQEVTNEGT